MGVKMGYNFDVLKYFDYYRNHTYNVVLAWKDIQTILIENEIISEEEFKTINHLIIWHDNSKISKEEFAGYGEKFFPLDEKTTNIDNFKNAWDHHKNNNLHHHQSLGQYSGSNRKCYLIEMICDWIAMGWEMNLLAEDYYNENKEKIKLLKEDHQMINDIFTLIKQGDCFSKGHVSSKEKTLILLK